MRSKGLMQYAYDKNGNPTTITTTGSGLAQAIQVETKGYDADNEVITDTVGGPNTASATTLSTYDLGGNQVEVEQPNGDVTFNTYDPANQLTNVEIDPVPVDSSNPNNSYTENIYDTAGTQVETRDIDQRDTTLQLDGDNRTISSVDNVISGTASTVITTTNQFDPNGNTLTGTVQTQPGTGTLQTSTSAATYNQADWTTSTTDTSNFTGTLVTGYTYDAAGQERTKSILGGTTPITETVDKEGRTTGISESLGVTNPYSTSFVYNANDLPTTETIPTSGTLSTVQSSYDQSSRLTGITTTLPATSTSYLYGYDMAGEITGITSTVGGVQATHAITHDALGRVTQDYNGSFTLINTYDPNGNITAIGTGTGGITSTFGYNSTTENEVITTSTPSKPTTYYGYDGHGDTTSITNNLGLSESLSYDSQARFTGLTAGTSAITLTYNAAGQRALHRLVGRQRHLRRQVQLPGR